MKEIDKLRMNRRQLEVDIKRLQDKVTEMIEDKKTIDRRIVMLQQSDNPEISGFKTSMFG